MAIRSPGLILAAVLALASGPTAAQTWSAPAGPTGVTALAVQGNTVLAGTFSGIRRSTNQGATWSSGGLNDWIRDLEVVGSTIYALTPDALYRSTNGGATWTQLLADSDEVIFSSVAIAGNTIYISNSAASGRLRKSTDGGRTWTSTGSHSCCGTKSLEVGVAAGIVYVAYFEVPDFFSGIARSTNGGASWARFDSGLPSDMDNYVITSSGGSVFASGDQGIYRLASGSSVWTWAAAGLGSSNVRDLDPAGSTLFAATAAGVYSSTNNGQSWSAQNSGLTDLDVSALAAGGGKLYAAHRSGIQRRDLAGSPGGIVDLTVGGPWVRGTIAKNGEQDWYRFTVSATAEHVVETELGTLTDTHLSLYGPSSQTLLIAQNDNADGRASRIRRSLAPGTYYAKVRAAGTSQTGAYRIRARQEVSKITVFLVHGLGQSNTDMNSLARNLRNETGGLDKDRFVVEATFDWSSCAARNGCPATCTIQNGGRALARHIKEKAPSGGIVLIGYSLGGLIARDMLLRNYESVATDRVIHALITLGTPNAGYPYCEIDNLARCDTLIQQMASHYRVQQDENSVVLSEYLYDLAVDWGASSFVGAPRKWLAAAGTSCQNATRLCEWNALDDSENQGCPDDNPASDAVVCQQSSLFRLQGLGNKPVEWSNANYRHSPGTLGFSVLCDFPRGIDLFAPPLASDLFKAIRQTIHEIQ